MVSLAVFAWTWVSTQAPDWLVPLASKVAVAWNWSVDQRLGLFAGAGAHEVGGDEEQAALLEGLQCHHRWLLFFSELWGSVADRSDSVGAVVSQVRERGGGRKKAAHWEGGEEALGPPRCGFHACSFCLDVHPTPPFSFKPLHSPFPLQVFSQMLHHSLADPGALSCHPGAAAARFRLLSLALRFCQQGLSLLPAGVPCAVPLAMLHDRVLKAAVMW
jgi:hypothetical protein